MVTLFHLLCNDCFYSVQGGGDIWKKTQLKLNNNKKMTRFKTKQNKIANKRPLRNSMKHP